MLFFLFLKLITTQLLKGNFRAITYFKYYHRWKASISSGRNAFSDKIPWMAFPAIDLLDRVVNKTYHVFEYGSGGSTLFLAQRAKKLVSVEHDNAWYKIVLQELKNQNISNVDYLLIEPAASSSFDAGKISNPEAYVSDDTNYAGMTFENYARAIESYPDTHFDLIVIDGRVRPSCIYHSLKKVKMGGYLLLDQSERDYYLKTIKKYLLTNEWRKTSFFAPLPYEKHFTETTFFKKVK